MRIKMFSIVRIAIGAAAILSGAVMAQQPNPKAWKCPGNLVTNGGFNSGTVIVDDGSMPASHTDA